MPKPSLEKNYNGITKIIAEMGTELIPSKGFPKAFSPKGIW